MFGENLNELSNIKLKINQLIKFRNEYKSTASEYEYINQLINNLKILRNMYDRDRNKYIKIMKKSYDKSKEDDKFNINDKILYYIGDRNSNSRKLKHRWTGPFTIINRINHNTIEITTNKKDETMAVHTSRVKKWRSRDNEYWNIDKYEKLVLDGTITDEINDTDLDSTVSRNEHDDFDEILDP